MTEKPHRVVVIDDHPIFREGLVDAFRTAQDIVVVGEAETADDAVELVLALRPEIVVIDLCMPGSKGERTTDSGLDAIRRIVDKVPDLRVVVVSSYEDEDLVLRALRAGAVGYCVKQSSRAEILDATRLVARGWLALGPAVATMVSGMLARLVPLSRPFPELNDDEYRIVEEVANRLTNVQIAAAVGLSAHTVANKLTIIYSTMDVSGRAELGDLARDKGVGRREPPPG